MVCVVDEPGRPCIHIAGGATGVSAATRADTGHYNKLQKEQNNKSSTGGSQYSWLCTARRTPGVNGRRGPLTTIDDD